MTTPKEALERIASTFDHESYPTIGSKERRAGDLAREALASLQGEDAVERVAQALLDRFIERSKCRSLSGKPTFRDGTKITELPASYRDDFEADARAILATGLVPDEAAVRAATSDMLLAGARSLGNTMGKPNFMQRAQACWDAMWKAKDGVVEPKPAAIRSNGRGA